MKKLAIISCVLIAMLFLSTFKVSASNFSIHTLQQGNSTTVTFKQLGYEDSVMDGPFDITRKSFNVPQNWELLPAGYIVLNYDVIFTGAEVNTLDTFAGVLTISYNNQIIGDVNIDESGSFTQQFQIPSSAIKPIRQDGQHELNIQLTSQYDCLYDVTTFVTIKSSSYFELPFEIKTPELDLRRLPAPFYMNNSLLPDKTILVIPDTPSVQELQAALNVQAGFGSMVDRNFDFQMLTLSQLTSEMLAKSNLIFVGTPNQFSLLQGTPFPNPISGGNFLDLPAEAVDDGIVELALSPWNENKVVMLISGNSGEAVIKAATAVSSGKIFVYQNNYVVYVSEVNNLTDSLPIIEDIKLQDLGFENITLEGIGVESEEYPFFLSKEQVETKEGEITLAYYHSGLIDYGLSSLSLYLNGEVITSQPFEQESEQLTYLPIKIPPGILKFGENILEITARMEPDLSCDTSGLSEPWVTISNQTNIHIPVAENVETIRPDLFDLKYYPTMFETHSDLADVAFILPENDPLSWALAGGLAYNLGESANPIIPAISVAFANDVPQEIRTGYSLIIIGKPDTLPLLSELNNSLPAPFDFNSNTANEKNMQIVYRLPQDVSIGYLQLLASPFNSEKIILVASGNSNQGVAMAGIALANEQLKDELVGVFAVTNGNQVAVSNAPSSSTSQFSIVGTLVPNSNQIVTTPLPSGQPNANISRPMWVMPLIVFSSISVLVIILFVAVRSFSKRRPSDLVDSENESNNSKTI